MGQRMEPSFHTSFGQLSRKLTIALIGHFSKTTCAKWDSVKSRSLERLLSTREQDRQFLSITRKHMILRLNEELNMAFECSTIPLFKKPSSPQRHTRQP